MVPSDTSVPRAKGTCVRPDGGVAPPGATVTAVTTPASPTLSSAHLNLMARFVFISLSPFRGLEIHLPLAIEISSQHHLLWKKRSIDGFSCSDRLSKGGAADILQDQLTIAELVTCQQQPQLVGRVDAAP